MSKDSDLTTEVLRNQESMILSKTSINNTELERNYQKLSDELRTEWPAMFEKLENLNSCVGQMVRIVEKLHPDWARQRVIQKIVNDHKELRGFSRATLWRNLPMHMKNPKSHRVIRTRKTADERGHEVYKADEDGSGTESTERTKEIERDLEEQKRKNQELEILLSQKGQALSSTQEQLAKTRTQLKNTEAKLEKGGHHVKEEEDQAEIEITVPKEKPDGSSLYRELYGIMAKKVEVFYLKCVVDKKGGILSATALEAVA